MDIQPFRSEHLDAAVGLFIASAAEQRRATPALPADRLERNRVTDLIARIMAECGGLAALEQGRLVGYLGWWQADDFRGTGRRAAYAPEWAHATAASDPDLTARVYRGLYRAAATQWAAAGCTVHALTLLAHDRAAETTWFWHGFGLLVVDAIRPLAPPGIAPTRVSSPAGLMIRPATVEDAPALAGLDAEHVRHYVAPPVFMAPRPADAADTWAAFLARDDNSAWLAVDQGTPVGFVRFDAHDYDGVDLLAAERVVGINGAYVQLAYRGRHAATAILDAALRDYAARGYEACAVNFESFNPEAAAFWPRYYAPVCLSMMRMPENPTQRI